MQPQSGRCAYLHWIPITCLGLAALNLAGFPACADGDDLPLILIDKLEVQTTSPPSAKSTMPVRIEYLPRPSANEQAILDKLTQSVEVVFRDIELPAAMSYLKEMYGIEFWIDQTRIPEEGVTVSLEISNISLKSCLKLMLEPHGLCFLIEDDVLKITTNETAESKIVTRTYPVADLIDSPEESAELKELLICGLGLAPTQNGVLPLTVSRKNHTLILRGPHRLHDELLQLLRDMRQVRAAEEPREVVLTIGYERNRDGTKRGSIPQVIFDSTIVDVKAVTPVLEQMRERLITRHGHSAIENMTVVIRRVDDEVSADWINQLWRNCQTAGFTRFSSRWPSELQ